MPLACRCGARLKNCLNSPSSSSQRLLDDVERVRSPVTDPTESNYHPSTRRGDLCNVPPHSSQIRHKGLWTGMDDLVVVGVVNSVRATQEPVPQPLIWSIGSHPIIRRRGNDPLKISSGKNRPNRFRLTAVSQAANTDPDWQLGVVSGGASLCGTGVLGQQLSKPSAGRFRIPFRALRCRW